MRLRLDSIIKVIETLRMAGSRRRGRPARVEPERIEYINGLCVISRYDENYYDSLSIIFYAMYKFHIIQQIITNMIVK